MSSQNKRTKKKKKEKKKKKIEKKLKKYIANDTKTLNSRRDQERLKNMRMQQQLSTSMW